jgi:hypothetical protein
MKKLGDAHLTSILKRNKATFMTTNFRLLHISLEQAWLSIWGKNALVYYNHNILGQTPKSNSKVLLKLDFSSCWPLLMC